MALKLRRYLKVHASSTFWFRVQIIGVVAAKCDARALYESLKSHLLVAKFIISMPAKLIVRFFPALMFRLLLSLKPRYCHPNSLEFRKIQNLLKAISYFLRAEPEFCDGLMNICFRVRALLVFHISCFERLSF